MLTGDHIMEKISDVLKRAMLAKGASKRSLSLKAGMGETYMHQYLTKGNPRELPESVRVCWAAELGLSPKDLMTEDLKGYRRDPTDQGVDTMPCYGGAQGRGPYDLRSDDYDIIECPHFLRGQPCFALYIKGDQPYPRFRRGEVIYIDRRSPVNEGDDVVIETKDGKGHLRRFIRMDRADEKRVTITEVYNPAGERRYEEDEIAGMYRIVGVRMPSHERKLRQ